MILWSLVKNASPDFDEDALRQMLGIGELSFKSRANSHRRDVGGSRGLVAWRHEREW